MKIYCQKCKTTEGAFVKISKSANKQTYYCRGCNTEKLKKYRNTEKGKVAIKQAAKKSYYKHYTKSMAKAKVSNAISSGKLIRPDKCSTCHKKIFTEAHHFDYSKPLDVLWLCKDCHCNIGKI